MSDTQDMKDRLRYLEELYDGDAATPEDAGAARELASLRKMKALLDARPKQAPDASAVSAVLAAARGESVPQRHRATDDRPAADPDQSGKLRRRGDRLPVARERSTVLRIGATSALVVLLLAVVGILHLEILDPATLSPEAEQSISSTERAADEGEATDEDSQSLDDAVQGRSDAPATASSEEVEGESASARKSSSGQTRDAVAASGVQARSAGAPERTAVAREEQSLAGIAETARPALEEESSARQSPAVASSAVAERIVHTGRSTPYDEEAVAWDERADVLEVYQHIEMIGSGVEQGWEPPSVPLEMLPPADRQPNLHQAGERQNPKP